MIYTGKYGNCKSGNLISISGDHGKMVGFEGKYYPELAPKLSFWKIWKENIGKISEYENTKFYINEYYLQVLLNADLESIIESDEDVVFLCNEDSEDFCHRHVLAEYIELKYGIKVQEIAIDEKGNITYKKRPKYIREILLEVIRENGLEELQEHKCFNCEYTISPELVDDIIRENTEYQEMDYDDACSAIGNCEIHSFNYSMDHNFYCEDYFPNCECLAKCKELKKEFHPVGRK